VASTLKICPKERNLTKYARGPIYRKLYAVWKEKVRLIAMLNALDCGACARSRVTTHKFHGAGRTKFRYSQLYELQLV
jgi:hypothetical protein